MPWIPELFSAPVLQRMQDKWRHDLVTVPFFNGLLAGEFDALLGSFAGQPELHHPIRGRVRGARAFEEYVIETSAWLRERNVSVENVEHVVAERRGFVEVVLHLDGQVGRIGVPVAVVSDRRSDGRIDELRMYFSSWPLTGRHAHRPPLLQPDPELRASNVVAEYQRALLAGDVEAIVAAFEPDGYAREPAGGQYIHRGPEDLRDFYERLFANAGGVSLEHCTLICDQRVCAVEYNALRWGKTELPPQAGIAVYVRGQSGKLAAVRVYDDVDWPFSSRAVAGSVPTPAFSVEVITLPVSDVDRAVRFYVDQIGFALDVDYAPTEAFRVVQLTPPGSRCSIQIGVGLTDAPAGSVRNTYLVVTDLEATRSRLLEHGITVGEIRHKTPIGSWDGGFAPGPDPERRDYASFADFSDPDGNSWTLQERGFRAA
jgi:catechol 2,3-dioxygenase-like lactoylglutathione lyase family enzyme